MKVLIVTSYTREARGGEARVPWELAPALSGKIETAILSPGQKHGTEELENNLKNIQYKAYEVDEGSVGIPDFSRKSVKNLFKSLDDYNPDLIHIHDVGFFNYLVQIWAAKNKKVVFFTSHLLPTRYTEFGDLEFLFKSVRKILNMSVRPYLRMFYENVDVVVALNKYAEKDIREFGYNGDIEIIPNGRDLEKLYRQKVADIDDEEKNLVFIGSLCKRKNEKYLVKMMRYLPENYKLHLIGGALNQKYKEDLEDLIENRNMNKQIKLHGQIDHSKIPSILSEKHVFVSASVMEVQSLVIVEALASGTPVVGLENETVKELIDDKVGRKLASDSSYEEFAYAVKEVCSMDSEKYGSMVEECRERVSHMDWDKVTERTLKIYQSYIEEIKHDNKRFSRLVEFLPDNFRKMFENRKSNKIDKKQRIPLRVAIISGILFVASTLVVLMLKFPKSKFRKFTEKLKKKVGK